MKYMYKQKSFSMVGVLMATVIFLLVSSVIVENMVFLIQTNNYKKYFLVGNYLANEGVETTKAILNRNIEQELASNTIDNPGEYTNAKLRWQALWDQGISPKNSIGENITDNDTYNIYRFNLSINSIVENGYIGIDDGIVGNFGLDIKNNPVDTDYELLPNNINGYVQGSNNGIKLYRQIDIIGSDGYDVITEPGIDFDGDSNLNSTLDSTKEIEVLSTVTLLDNNGRKYLYQVREKIPRPNLYN